MPSKRSEAGCDARPDSHDAATQEQEMSFCDSMATVLLRSGSSQRLQEAKSGVQYGTVSRRQTSEGPQAWKSAFPPTAAVARPLFCHQDIHLPAGQTSFTSRPLIWMLGWRQLLLLEPQKLTSPSEPSQSRQYKSRSKIQWLGHVKR